MNPVRSLAAAAALLTLLSAPAAQAANIGFQILTTVTTESAFVFGPHAGLFTLGEPVQIDVTFDDDADDVIIAPGAGGFLSALSQFDVQFLTSGLSFRFGNPFSEIGTSDDVPSGLDSVSFGSASPISADTLGGESPTSIAMLLAQDIQPNGPADLVVNDRPVAGPFDFTEAAFTVVTGSGQTQLLLEAGSATAVPEPSLTLLLGLGIYPAWRHVRREH